MLKPVLFPKELATNFWSFDFCIHFMLEPGPNPVPECFTAPVPLRQELRFQRFRLRFHNTDDKIRKEVTNFLDPDPDLTEPADPESKYES